MDFGAGPSESLTAPEKSAISEVSQTKVKSAEGESKKVNTQEKKGRKTKEEIEAEIKARIEKKEKKRQDKLEAKRKKREEEKPTEKVNFEELPRKL